MKYFYNRRLFFIFTLLIITLSTILFSTPSIQATDSQKANLADTPKGQTLYTQFTFFYEENYHVTTNYRKGILVPVNTEVKFVKAKRNTIVVTLPNGQDLEIENIEAYSGEKIEGIFNRTFGINPVNLSKFTAEEKNAIIAGEVKVGMGKSAVIVALGYPPKHKTSSLQLDQWQYWHNRFDTFVVYFENDRVKQIND